MITSTVSMVMENPVVKRVPYVGPVIGSIGLAMDLKDIAENATPLGVVKTIGGRLLKVV